jgi:hypothetical protein
MHGAYNVKLDNDLAEFGGSFGKSSFRHYLMSNVTRNQPCV